jgi:serine/alanine adding enzyme
MSNSASVVSPTTSVKFEILSSVEAFDDWDNFVRRQPYHNAFQSGAFARAFLDFNRYSTRVLVVRDGSTNEILGGLVGLCITEKSGLLAQLTTRVIINGGPIVASGAKAFLPSLLERAKTLFKDRPVCYTEIWCMQAQDDVKAVYPADYQHSGHLNFFVETGCSWEEIFKRYSSALRKTIRNNSPLVRIERITAESQLQEFYRCVASTYERVGVPLIPIEVFQQVFRTDLGIFLLAFKDTEVVGARVVLPFGDEVYDWYAGSYDSHKQLNINALLVNHILKNASADGIRRFNFGGAGKPDKPYGPRDFKRRFGGELVDHGRWLFVNSRLRYKLLQLALILYRKFNKND